MVLHRQRARGQRATEQGTCKYLGRIQRVVRSSWQFDLFTVWVRSVQCLVYNPNTMLHRIIQHANEKLFLCCNMLSLLRFVGRGVGDAPFCINNINAAMSQRNFFRRDHIGDIVGNSRRLRMQIQCFRTSYATEILYIYMVRICALG